MHLLPELIPTRATRVPLGVVSSSRMAHVGCIWDLPACPLEYVLVSRFGQYFNSRSGCGHTSRSLQVTGVILSTIAFVIAAEKFQVTTWDSTHACEAGVGYISRFWGTAVRPAWFVRFTGWSARRQSSSHGSIFSIERLGLVCAELNWPNGGERKASYVLWGINVGILAFLYLFLERLPYIRFQAMDPNVNVNKTSTGITNKTYRDSATRADAA